MEADAKEGLAGRPGSAATWLAAMALVAGTSTAGIFRERREAPKQLTKYDEERLEAARQKRARRAAKKSPNAPASATPNTEDSHGS